VSESDDLHAFIRELMEEFDRKLDAWEARARQDREELLTEAAPERPPAHLDFSEDRRQRALLLERARRLGRKRDE
jgi:hypothetical protein